MLPKVDTHNKTHVDGSFEIVQHKAKRFAQSIQQ